MGYFANKIKVWCGLYLLFLIHFIYSVLVHFSNYLFFIFSNCKRWYRRTPIAKSSSISFLREEVKCFPKLPKHLAVIIDEKEISYNDCIKLISWCTYAGIPFITFYSSNSAINPTSLYEVLYKKSKSSLQSIKWGKSFHESVTEMAKKDINGYTWAPLIEVNIFSSKSIHDSIENVLLRLCQCEVDLEQLNLAAVEEMFKEEVPLPDPCLAVVFGKTFSTFGFMPWQIRVTELFLGIYAGTSKMNLDKISQLQKKAIRILLNLTLESVKELCSQHVATHHNLTIEDFLSVIRNYAYCEQRFGK